MLCFPRKPALTRCVQRVRGIPLRI
jgi:hypothetical protein